MYAFDLVQKRAKRPVGAPDKALAKKVTKVGIIGAGLMASQFALLFVRRLQVPVLITDLDQARVDKGVAYIRDEIGKLEAKGRLDGDEANRLRALVHGTTDKADFADCDFVIEAVFEEVGVKQEVFAEIEQIIAEDAILATNTSSLSVEEIGAKLAHPERLVGFHFFNPVAVMPLIEIVKTPHTDDAALSTALVVAQEPGQERGHHRRHPRVRRQPTARQGHGRGGARGRRGHPVRDRREGVRAPRPADGAVPAASTWSAGRSARTCRTRWRTRSPTGSPRENLHQLAELPRGRREGQERQGHRLDKAAEKVLKGAGGKTPAARTRSCAACRTASRSEIRIMLDEGVVAAAEDIDLCLILGAGWPFIEGGASPYLDRVGASERVFGDTFHHPVIRGIGG